MAVSLGAVHLYFGLTLCVWLFTPAFAQDPNQEVCNKWAEMAQQLTVSGIMHNCTNKRTSECARIDCSGYFSLAQPPLLSQSYSEVDLCYGIQLNSCNNPISVDFYLQVPQKNVSLDLRLTHDTDYQVPGLNFNFGPVLLAYPVLRFTFEKENDSGVLISVAVVVTIQTNGIVGEKQELKLLHRKIFPLKHCNTTTHDIAERPSNNFIPAQCSPVISAPAANTSSPAVNYTQSTTLGKNCDPIMSFCGQLEACDSSQNPPKCNCTADSLLSPKKDACLSTSRLNQHCEANDCGPNEYCERNSTSPVCLCKHGHSPDAFRVMCIHKSPDAGTVTNNPGPQTTPQPNKENNKDGSAQDDKAGHEGEHNLPIYVGVSLAGAVTLGLVIWGTMFCIRKRNRLPRSAGDTEASTPMLSNDDSDNLIM